MNDIVIIGAGGHAKVVYDVAVAAGRRERGFLNDSPNAGGECLSLPVLGSSDVVSSFPDCEFIIAVGGNAVRKKLAEKLKVKYAVLVHPSAVVSPCAEIGEGSVVMPLAVINSGARAGRHVIVNSAAVIEHDCVLGDFSHVSPGAVLAGTVRIAEGVWVGAGAVIKNNVTVSAAFSVIGAGAVTVKNIEESGTYVGIPATKMHRQGACDCK